MTDGSWLIVGLGNPEADYAGTRHNVGADAVRALASRHGKPLSRNKRVNCELAEVRIGGAKAALAVPCSFMNTSGGPVQQAARWFSAAPAQVVVVHDDLDLDVGNIRLKIGGGAGGQNGVTDVARALGTQEFHRVRIGIGRPPGRMAARDYVLRRFQPADRDIIDVVVQEAGDAVESLIANGLAETQNRFHARNSAEPS